MRAAVEKRLAIVRVLLEQGDEQVRVLTDLVKERQRHRGLQWQAPRRRPPFDRAVTPPLPLLLRPRQHLRGRRIRIDVREPYAREIGATIPCARGRTLLVRV